MQLDTGTAMDFVDLFKYSCIKHIDHLEYNTLQLVTNDLLLNLRFQSAVAFAYERTNGTGHMLVVFKALSSVNNWNANVYTPSWGGLRHIDYQTRNPQPVDGVLPSDEQAIRINKFHIFSPRFVPN